MTPYDQIRREYFLHPRDLAFWQYEEWHKEHGFVFATPEFYVMARPIRRQIEDEMTIQVIDAFATFPREQQDTWYVHALAGDMARAWSILPWNLPWMAFDRMREGKRELQLLPTDTLRRLCPPSLISIP